MLSAFDAEQQQQPVMLAYTSIWHIPAYLLSVILLKFKLTVSDISHKTCITQPCNQLCSINEVRTHHKCNRISFDKIALRQRPGERERECVCFEVLEF